MESTIMKKMVIVILVVFLIPILFSTLVLATEAHKDFGGEKGAKVTIVNAEIMIPTDGFVENSIQFFNVLLPSGLTVYFFIIKDYQKKYRAAANACQLCYPSQEGFHQEKNLVVCNVCGNPYSLEKIATEKGDCNPVPISKQLEVRDKNIVIYQSDLEKLSPYFNT